MPRLKSLRLKSPRLESGRLSSALRLASLLAATALFAPQAFAQADWPSKPVRIVVPFATGGTTDISARVIADQLTQSLKQTFIVDNKAGAGGNIGAGEVARAAPDGYTFLMGTPGAFSYGSPGNGTTGHLSTELLKTQAGISVAHVPYRGSGPMLIDLIGGQIQMAIDNLPSAMAQIKSGKVIALGVTSTAKVSTLPDVTPIASVAPGYEAESWFVLMAPAGTPPAIVNKLAAEVDRILKKPEVIERFRELGAEPVGGSPESLGTFITSETKKWQQVVKDSGARID